MIWSPLRFDAAPRALIAFVLAIAGLNASNAAATSAQWRFAVRLDGKPIGTHRFVLSPVDGGGHVLDSEADFEVSLLGVALYRYRHRVSEGWTDGCLVSIDAHTDDNGRLTTVNGRAQEGRFDLQVRNDGGAARSAVEPVGCLMSFAYWNPKVARQQRLLDAGSGRVERVVITAPAAVPDDFDAAVHPVRGLRIGGLAQPIDVWYVGDRWIGLDTLTGDGRRLSYRLH